MTQWGFTALHYATVARSKDVVLFLLANGASAITLSKVSLPFMLCCLVTLMNEYVALSRTGAPLWI